MVLALTLSAGAQTATEVSATGYITDTLCGRKGATAQHADHARRSVASGKAKYALYDERTRQLYILDPQETAAQHLGQRVTITGTLAAAPEKRAGQKAEPAPPGADPSADPVVVRHTPRAGAPLDTSTPIAGVLTISTISPAPLRR
jgi:hypothetical protein